MKDFKQRVLEQQIFDDIKDCSLKNGEYFRKKYKGVDIDFSRLYRRIVNYQIKEYGCTLDVHIPYRSKEECDRIAARENARKRYGRNK
jgi:hypothetical protein